MFKNLNFYINSKRGGFEMHKIINKGMYFSSLKFKALSIKFSSNPV